MYCFDILLYTVIGLFLRGFSERYWCGTSLCHLNPSKYRYLNDSGSFLSNHFPKTCCTRTWYECPWLITQQLWWLSSVKTKQLPYTKVDFIFRDILVELLNMFYGSHIYFESGHVIRVFHIGNWFMEITPFSFRFSSRTNENFFLIFVDSADSLINNTWLEENSHSKDIGVLMYSLQVRGALRCTVFIVEIDSVNRILFWNEVVCILFGSKKSWIHLFPWCWSAKKVEQAFDTLKNINQFSVIASKKLGPIYSIIIERINQYFLFKISFHLTMLSIV